MTGVGWKMVIEHKRDVGHSPSMRMLPALLLQGACQHTSADVGPNPDEFVAAILNAPEVAGPTRLSTSELRSLGCRRFDEEPTEFLCRFQSRDATGAWRNRSAIVATDAEQWVLLSLN